LNYAAVLVAVLIAVCIAGAAGWRIGVKMTLADWNAERVQQQEHTMLLAKARAVVQRKIDDEITTELVASADRARDADERLRRLAAKYRREHAGAQCRDDAPPAARLSDATRADLIQLARDADACAVALRAWQQRESMNNTDQESPR
jgi:hypothetical protein